jgi:hypothetical protein
LIMEDQPAIHEMGQTELTESNQDTVTTSNYSKKNRKSALYQKYALDIEERLYYLRNGLKVKNKDIQATK